MCLLSMLIYIVHVTHVLQGDRGPPGLPAGLGEDWAKRVDLVKVYIEDLECMVLSGILF